MRFRLFKVLCHDSFVLYTIQSAVLIFIYLALKTHNKHYSTLKDFVYLIQPQHLIEVHTAISMDTSAYEVQL